MKERAKTPGAALANLLKAETMAEKVVAREEFELAKKKTVDEFKKCGISIIFTEQIYDETDKIEFFDIDE